MVAGGFLFHSFWYILVRCHKRSVWVFVFWHCHWKPKEIAGSSLAFSKESCWINPLIGKTFNNWDRWFREVSLLSLHSFLMFSWRKQVSDTSTAWLFSNFFVKEVDERLFSVQWDLCHSLLFNLDFRSLSSIFDWCFVKSLEKKLFKFFISVQVRTYATKTKNVVSGRKSFSSLHNT